MISKSNKVGENIVMLVKCIGNTGECIDKATKKWGDSISTKYPLKTGENYVIYGQFVCEGIIQYLVLGTYENLPSWYPAELFEMVENATSIEWYFKFKGYSNIPIAVWGYKELVLDDAHYNSLIEREPKAIEIFLKRKKEIDEMENLRQQEYLEN